MRVRGKWRDTLKQSEQNRYVFLLIVFFWNLTPVFAQPASESGRLFPWESAQIECLLKRSGLNDPVREPSQESCSVSRAPGQARSFESLQSTFRDAFCTRPRESCEVLRGAFFETSTERADSEQVFFDARCNSHPLVRLSALETERSLSDITRTLRERTGIDHAGLAVYRTQEWQNYTEVFELAKEALLETLGPRGLNVPETVLAKIRAARLFDPHQTSLTAEQRSEALAPCSISAASLEEGVRTSDRDQLGEFNAFAGLPADIVICPKVVLSTQSPEAIGTVLLHELSHLVGPCLLGYELASFRQGPRCTLSSIVSPQVEGLRNWRRRTHRVEECFYRAGINRGRNPRWLIALVEGASDNANSATADPTPTPNPSEAGGCGVSLRDFEASNDIDQGLASTCDRSLLVISGALHYGLRDLDEEATRYERLRARVRAQRLNRMVDHPDENQFNEALSDALASRTLPAFLARSRLRNPGTNSSGEELAWSLGFLCDLDQHRADSRMFHPDGNRRMEILSSDPQTRALLGCEADQRPRSRLSRRLEECLNQANREPDGS